MKYFSTFSGIGGFERGIDLSNLDAECVGYSEIDKYASAIYQYQYPNHRNYGDITTINESELPDFDLYVGGFPCQAFSIAGKRQGFKDTRGTLFFDVARILSAKRPTWVVLENVKGLLNHDGGRTITTIFGVLSDIGYSVGWEVVNSCHFGVPQNRERIFIVGHLGERSAGEVFPIGRVSKEPDNIQQEKQGQREWVSGKVSQATGSHELSESGGRGRRRFSSKLKVGDYRKDEGFRWREDNKSPTLCARARQDVYGQPVIQVPEATKRGYAEAREGQAVNLSVPNSKTRRGRVSDIAHTLDTGMQQYTPTGQRIRRLTPTECERLQGFPDGWTKYGVIKGQKKVISDTQRYKTLGNAVTVNVITAIMNRMYDQSK